MIDPLARFKKTEYDNFNDPLEQFKPKVTNKINNIFEEVPKNTSSFNSRKQLNTKPMTDGIDLIPIPKTYEDTGFWANVRNNTDKITENPVFKAITAIPNKLYEIPFTQRLITKSGEAIAGEGAYKNSDGSVMRPMDTGNKLGNAVADIAGMGLGFSMPMAGISSGKINTVNNISDDVLKPLSDLALKPYAATAVNKLASSNAPKLLQKAVPMLADYGENAIRSGLDAGIGNAIQEGLVPLYALGKDSNVNLKDVAKSGLEGFGQGAAFGTALKGLGDIKKSALPNWKTTFESATPTKQSKALNSHENPLLEPRKTQSNIITPNLKTEPIQSNLQANAPINLSIGATDRLNSMQQIVSSKDQPKANIKDRWNNLYTRFIDSNSPIKKINEDTYIKATNSKNVGVTVDHILTEALVDRQGNKIGESFKSVVKDIPKEKENDFMNYVLQKHNIDRAREGKPVFTDFTSEESAKAVKLLEQKFPEFKGLNDRLVKFLNTFEGEWGNKSGLVSDDLWKSLQDTYKNYVPTQRSFSQLEQGFSATNGRGFVDQGNTLKRAKGSERDIINPLENIMSLVNRTVRTARYNEVGQSMVEAIRKDPAGLRNIAEIVPDNVKINQNVNNIVSVLEGGKPVNVQINNNQLLDALQGINKGNLDDLDNAFKKVTNLFKTLVTQKNPVFAIRNIARDIPTAYINGNEANPIKFTRDLLKAGKQLATNAEEAQRYKAVGGGGSNFFKSNNTAKSLKDLTNKSLFKKSGDVIETINNITESAPRLAEFNRVLDKTGDINKALYAANDVTTNFSRGGDIAKKVDAYVPYLNAGLQGLDKLRRQFITKPIPTAAKGLIGITSMSLVLDHINKDNPNYQKLDNRTKDTYFILPDLNNDGKFIKIPKTREYGVIFANLFERSLRLARGDKEAFKGFGNTVKNSFAINPLENILTPMYNLKANKDFANRDIVPRVMLEDGRSKHLQYDEKTSELTKWLAEQMSRTGAELSPKQIDYLIKSYTGVIGQLGLPATTKATMTGTTVQKLLKPITSQFIADPLYNNQAISDFYENYDKIKTKAADRNIIENIPSDRVTKEEKLKNDYAKLSKTLTEYNKKIREAELKNNADMVKSLRIKMIDTAVKANKIYNSK